MDIQSEIVFCFNCGIDIKLVDTWTHKCSEIGISYLDSLFFESENFDRLMFYPKNYILIDK